MQNLLASPYRTKRKHTLRWRRASTQRYPGQYYDAESTLHYNYFRDYEPGTGRYVQSDPIGQLAGVNTYAYVGSSPLLWSDMFGLLQWRSNPAQWQPVSIGSISYLYPNGHATPFRPGTLAKTTLDWSVSTTCACSGGSFTLNEFSVAITPKVLLRQSYKNNAFRSAVRAKELEHIRDLRSWMNSARSGAQSLEDNLKGVSFSTEAECISNAESQMQGFLRAGAQGAVNLSSARWDATGLHALNEEDY